MTVTDFSSTFVRVYDKALTKEKEKFSVNDNRIRDAIRIMKDVYMPKPQWQSDHILKIADYNDAAHRCAYIHKYALCYTGMVCDLLQIAMRSNDDIFTFFSSKRRLTLCSLGGGPGTDIVGAMAALYACFGFMPCSVTILDYAKDWQATFSLILQELRFGSGGLLRDMVSPPHFKHEYLSANLLTDIRNKSSIQQRVMASDLLTMIKFISAAACQHTRDMVECVFNCMKPGAMLLFIDNAAGGFLEVMQQAANQYGMVSIFGPLRHYDYENEAYSITRFGYTSQSKTKISVQVWKKPHRNPYHTTQELRREYVYQDRIYSQGSNVRVNRAESLVLGRDQNENQQGCCSLI